MKKVMAMKGMKAGPAPKPKMTGKPVNANEKLRAEKKMPKVGNVKAETGTNPYKGVPKKANPAPKPVRTGKPVAANEALRKKKQGMTK